MTPVPSTVVAGEALPDLEVRIMTSSFEFVDDNGQELLFPLTNGPDIDIDIQLTISWDQKIFAMNDLPLDVQDGVDVSRLLYSNITLNSLEATETYLGDIAIRKRATLLPGGYYGAVFEGVRLLNVTDGVRLNFTMSYPGGWEYKELKHNFAVTPPAPFSRVGLGYTDYEPIWENVSRVEFLEGGADNSFLIFGPVVTQLTALEIYEDHLYSVNGSITALPDVTVRAYRGLGTALRKASASDCAKVPGDMVRQEWCNTSGYISDVSADIGPGVLLTDLITVVGGNATSAVLTWNRQSGFTQIRNVPSVDPVIVALYDDNNDLVISGSDAELVPLVEAVDAASGVSLPLCRIHREDCEGSYSTNHISGCSPMEGVRFQQGVLSWKPTVCAPSPSVYLRVTITTSDGDIIIVATENVSIANEVPVGILIPERATSNPVDLPHAAVKQFTEMVTKGSNYEGLEYTPGYLTPFGGKLIPYYIYTVPSAKITIDRMKAARLAHGIRHWVGPYNNENAEAIGDWIATETPEAVAFSPNAVSLNLEDTTRFHNSFRMRTSFRVQLAATGSVLSARKWNRIAILQDKSVSPLSEEFYVALRSKGISILADVDVGATDDNASMVAAVNAIKTAGARVIFTALSGPRTASAYLAAIGLQLGGAHGYQWFGNDQAHAAFPVDVIPDVQQAFEGILFLTTGYGYEATWQYWFNQMYYQDSKELYTSEGGMDPFHVSLRGFDYSDLNPWAKIGLKLLGDSVMMVGWMFQWAVMGGTSMNAQFARWEIQDSAFWGGWSGNVSFGLSSHARESFSGMFVQLKSSNLTHLRAVQNPLVAYNPWQVTTGITVTLSQFMYEEPLLNTETMAYYPPITWGSNITTTQRQYITLNAASKPIVAIDYVPITHVCNGGCGGQIKNASLNAYVYEHGTCVAPNVCECVLRQPSGKPAFQGTTCGTALCDVTCRNGDCVYENNDTRCECEVGWISTACNVPVCAKYGCSQASGTCVLPDTCECQTGYFSPDCSAACTCGSNGNCNDGSSGTGECTCNAGFFGKTCDSECTCVNGVCNDGAQGNGQCASCDSGWIGADCDLRLALVVAPALVGGLILSLVFFWIVKWFLRRARFAALLSNMDWKVNYADIEFSKNETLAQSVR